MRACSIGLVGLGLGIRLGLVLGIGLVLGLEMVLGLAHFTFCHTSSQQKPAGPHFTHNLISNTNFGSWCLEFLL